MNRNTFIISALLLLIPMASFAADEPINAAPKVSIMPTPYPEPSQQMLKDFEQYVEKTMKEWKIPGMGIGIVQGDKVIYTKGFGVKTLGSDDPINPDTIFQIGSITKSFTATLTAMLVDEGKLKWGDNVKDFLPDFMMYDPWVTKEFQVADLMEQRSGLPSHAGDPLYILGFDRDYIEHAIRFIKPVSSFRTEYSYINVIFLYVADIIEKLSGKSWGQNLSERLFTPLGMSNSSFDLQSFRNAKNVASPHVNLNDKMIPLSKDWPYLYWSYTAGPSGAINSNITDMTKWLSFQMNHGKIKDKQLVSENNINFIHSPKTPITSNSDGGNMFYGLGWIYRENDPLPIIWHDGAVTGMKSMIAFVPNANIGIIILSNSSTEMPEFLAMRFFDQYFGKKLQDYSGEMLAEVQKAEQQSKNQEPIPSKNPAPLLPLEKYTGNYFNNIYGTSNISLADGKLIISIGNKGMIKMTLSPLDKTTFILYGSLFSKDERNGFIKFDVDTNGNVKNFTIDPLNEKFEKV